MSYKLNLRKLKKQREDNEVGENSPARNVDTKSQKRCLLIDWADEDGNVAEGRMLSSDPNDIVNESRLGPMNAKVFVDAATEPEAF
ncbi:unnamed protein product, partial [Brassica oleracea]